MSDTETKILCPCDNECIKLTVKKEGPNQGRVFYQCSKPQGKCGFHQWEDELKKQADSDSILCKCGDEAKQLTVKKEGKNQGRIFYQCKKFKGKCGFFKWDDDLKRNVPKAKKDSEDDAKKGEKRELEEKDDGSSDGSGSGSDSDAETPPPILCKCNEETRRLTVKKEGKNQGRVFYQCKKFQGKCGFHQWEDELQKNLAKKAKTEADE